LVDTIHGSSIANLKELRPGHQATLPERPSRRTEPSGQAPLCQIGLCTYLIALDISLDRNRHAWRRTMADKS
jgi:hypothetical protein